MSIITIPKNITGKEDLVVMSRKEYEKMKARMLPEVYLSGKSATCLDRRVATALRNHRQGKTRKIKSLADLD